MGEETTKLEIGGSILGAIIILAGVGAASNTGDTVIEGNIGADYTINIGENIDLNKPAETKYGDWTNYAGVSGTASLPLNIYAEDKTGTLKGYLVQGNTPLASLLECGFGLYSYSNSDVTFKTLDNQVLLTNTQIPGTGGFSRNLWFKQPVTLSGDSTHIGAFSKVITIDVTVVYP